MNDPVVEELHYKFKTADGISFDNPPVLEEDFPLFNIKLDNCYLVIKLKEECESEDLARKLIEPYLDTWELDHLLSRGQKEFWFDFIKSKVVDRNPNLTKTSKIMKTQTGKYILKGRDVSFPITRKNYPLPSRNLLYTPDVASLSKRYEGFLNGKEPLLSMAYFCLTVVQAGAGDRGEASKKYNIEPKVLNKLGELTSTSGDRTEARKLDKLSSQIALTNIEKHWVQETIKILLRRKAEYDFNSQRELPLIGLSTLPPI